MLGMTSGLGIKLIHQLHVVGCTALALSAFVPCGSVRARMQALAIHDDPRVSDAVFMVEALRLARAGAAAGEVPIGALVVVNGEIIGTAHNAPISRVDPTAHAEVLALRAAAQARGNYRLSGATLYVTVEPCAMCVGAAIQARVERVVFGCREPKAGALGSVFDLIGDGRLNHRFTVTEGVLADEASRLLQQIFRLRRGA